MNETVKAALLAERERARTSSEYHAREVATLRRQLASHEAEVNRLDRRYSDIELHLKDNGVDLAAVDAEAEKARPVINLGGQHSIMGQQNGLRQDSLAGVNTGLGQGYGQALNSLNGDSSNQLRGSLNARTQYDATAGLAKALDEA